MANPNQITGRPVTIEPVSRLYTRLLRIWGLYPEDVRYKLNKIMTDIFKKDALLYVAFIVLGLTSMAKNIWEALAVTAVATLVLVARSYVKKKIK